MKNDVIKKYVKDLDGLFKEVKESKGKLGDIDAETIYNVESAVVFAFGMIFKFFNFSSITFGSRTGIDAVVELNNDTMYLEFETVSSNFERHKHIKEIKKGESALIVCWEDDWKDHPKNIDILELKRFFSAYQNLES